ncbi:hypothetical protein [Micromonospora sp. NPDC048898]
MPSASHPALPASAMTLPSDLASRPLGSPASAMTLPSDLASRPPAPPPAR